MHERHARKAASASARAKRGKNARVRETADNRQLPPVAAAAAIAIAALGGDLVRYLTFPCARVWELCRDKYLWKTVIPRINPKKELRLRYHER